MNRRTALLRVFSIFAVSALLLTGCSYMTEPTPERPADMRGEITQVKTEDLRSQQALAEILIEEDPSVPLDEWLNQPEGYSKVSWKIMPNMTQMYRQEADRSLVKIGVEDLTVGSEVHAWNTGFYVDTGLPIAYAEKIILVSPAP